VSVFSGSIDGHMRAFSAADGKMLWDFDTAKDPYEAVNGVIESGKDGRFIVDIPMFSHRAFLHEAAMKGDKIPVKIVSWDGAGTLKQLVLSVGPDFTKQILEGWVVQGDQIYPMKIAKDTLEFGISNRQSLEAFGVTSRFEIGYRTRRLEAPDVDGEFRKLARPLIAWSLSLEDFTPTNAPPSAPAPNLRARLFLFAHSPQGFYVQGSELGQEAGYVLYQFDLFKPETAGKYE